MHQPLTPDGIESLITATEAAGLCDVTTTTVRSWVSRGHLTPAGVDPKGRNLFKLIDVARVEKATRKRARR